MTLTEESKNKIDALTLEELRAEVLLENKSRFQGEKAAYVLARFGQLQEEKRDDQRAEDTESEIEKTNIAKEANDISREANKFSKLAIWVSVFALIISLLNFIHNVSISDNSKPINTQTSNDQKP